MEYQIGEVFLKVAEHDSKGGLKKIVIVSPLMFNLMIAVWIEWVKPIEPPQLETITYPRGEQWAQDKVRQWLLE